MRVDMDTTQAPAPQPPPAIPTLPEPSPTTAASTAALPPAVKDIIFGSVAGILGKVVEYPFDTVKVRLQSQPDHLPLRYTGPLDCFRQSLAEGGVRGLYRGVSAPLAGAGAETASLFWSYEVAKKALVASGMVAAAQEHDGNSEADLPLPALITAGAMSGGLTSLILTPIELVKCRMQVPLHSPLDPNLGPRAGLSSTSSVSPFAVIADVYRREGLRGFWRGQTGTFLRETGGTAAWFGAYEASALFFARRMPSPSSSSSAEKGKADLPLYAQLASGALAGMSYNFLFYPADTIKSKIQTGELSHQGARPTFLSTGRALWNSHGLRGLYRGCGITVARSAPSSALIFTVVERLRGWFG